MASSKKQTVEKQVEYGLNLIDKDRTVEVSLRDLIFIHQTLAELVRFFHQQGHYKALADVKRFMGNRNAGTFHLINECVYRKMEKMIPPDIQELFDRGDFSSPTPPYYVKKVRH